MPETTETWTCDDCAAAFIGPKDHYGTVGVAVCGACTGGEPVVGPIETPPGAAIICPYCGGEYGPHCCPEDDGEEAYYRAQETAARFAEEDEARARGLDVPPMVAPIGGFPAVPVGEAASNQTCWTCDGHGVAPECPACGDIPF